MRFVNYKILLLGFLVLLVVLFLTNITQEISRVRESEKSLDELEEELTYEEARSEFLNEQVKYVQTDKFIEEESREKLGLVKSGEAVVQQNLEARIQKNILENISKPNWKQWLELFF